jgi:hypothetical protein
MSGTWTTPTVTDEQLLAAMRMAYMQLACSGAQSYTINGRMFTRFDIEDIQKAISWLETRIDLSAQPNMGTILVQTGSF